MPMIAPDGVAVLLSSPRSLDARCEDLRHATGFLGAALFRSVRPWGERVAYARWNDQADAMAALDSGDLADLRAVPVEAISVRRKTAPQDHASSFSLDTPGSVALIVRMSVNPERYDALMREQETSTDRFLSDFRGVRVVAQHVSTDHALVIEVLQVASVAAMARIRLNPRLRRHIKRVGRIARSVSVDIYRLEKAVGSFDPGQ